MLNNDKNGRVKSCILWKMMSNREEKIDINENIL